MVKTSGSPGLLRALLQSSSRKPVREVALQLYCERVLAAKTAVDSTTLWAYSPLVASLQHEEVGGVVVPSVSKAIRRNPEVGLPVAARLLSDVNLDLSRHSSELLPAFVQALRNAKEENREMAVKCVKQLGKQLSQVDALSESAQVLRSLLEGKTEGKIKSVQERASLMCGLEALAVGVGVSRSGALLTSTVVEFCCEFYAGEGIAGQMTLFLSVVGLMEELIPSSQLLCSICIGSFRADVLVLDSQRGCENQYIARNGLLAFQVL